MKKLSIPILLFYLFSSFSFGQTDVSLAWGADVGDENQILKVLGETEEGVYAMATHKKKFYLECYTSQEMKLKFSTPLVFPDMDSRSSELANVFLMEDDLVLFTVNYNKSINTYSIIGYNLNKKGEIESEGRVIMDIVVEKKRRMGEFGFKLSKDRSKLLIFHSAPHRKGEDKWVINMKVLTSQLFPLKEFHEEFPIVTDRREYIKISNYLVDDNAAVYMAISKMGWDKNLKAITTFDLRIFQYEPTNGFERREIKIKLQNKIVTSIALAFTPDGDLIGSGFYSARGKGFLGYNGIAGTFFARIDRLEGEVTKVASDDFGQEFAATILKEKQAAKGRLVPNRFIPRKVIPKADGGVILLAEYYTVSTSETSTMKITSYQHGPIIVANITSKGEIQWVRSIPKNQIYNKKELALGVAGGGVGFAFGALFWFNLSKDQTIYHSFITGIGEDKIYLAYNDNPKNIEIEHFRDTKALNGYKGSVPVVVSIDGEGNMEKEILRGKDKSEVVLRPKISFQDNYQEVITFGSRRKMNKFGRLTFR